MEQGFSSSGLTSEFRLSVSEGAYNKKLALMITGGGMVLLGGYTLLVGGNAVAVAVAVGVAALLGGVIYLFSAYGSRKANNDRGVQVRVDVTGLTTPPYAEKMIPWSAIEGVTFRRERGGMITMNVSIPDHKSYGLLGRNRWLAGLNRMLGGGHLVIEVDPLEGTPGDLLRAIQTASPGTQIASNYPVV